MKIRNLPIESIDDSNMFLRALWACIRRKFGGLSWQYMPHKDGSRRQISFGYMVPKDTGPDSVNVVVEYRQRGILSAIYFFCGKSTLDAYPNAEKIFRDCVYEALEVRKNENITKLSIQISSHISLPLKYYVADRWFCGPLSNNNTEISVYVNGFDEIDAKNEFFFYLEKILSLLPCFTNCEFVISKSVDGDPTADDSIKNEYSDNRDWIDDYPIIDRHIVLTKNQVDYINMSLSTLDAVPRIDRAAGLFSSALKLERSNRYFHDMATALYLSSLETVDIPIDPMTCDQCGQVQYKISQRVVDLAVRHLGEGSRRHVKKFYSRRSTYLHSGHTVGSRPSTGNSIPQIDLNEPEDCVMPRVHFDMNVVREFTSYIIRHEVDALFEPKVADTGAGSHNG